MGRSCDDSDMSSACAQILNSTLLFPPQSVAPLRQHALTEHLARINFRLIHSQFLVSLGQKSQEVTENLGGFDSTPTQN